MKAAPLLLLCACSVAAVDSVSPSASAEEDVGVVTVTCTFSYLSEGANTTGTYPGFTTDCEGWAESGEQSMEATRADCEEAGLEDGADTATCACEVDTGTCTFPDGVND